MEKVPHSADGSPRDVKYFGREIPPPPPKEVAEDEQFTAAHHPRNPDGSYRDDGGRARGEERAAMRDPDDGLTKVGAHSSCVIQVFTASPTKASGMNGIHGRLSYLGDHDGIKYYDFTRQEFSGASDAPTSERDSEGEGNRPSERYKRSDPFNRVKVAMPAVILFARGVYSAATKDRGVIVLRGTLTFNREQDGGVRYYTLSRNT